MTQLTFDFNYNRETFKDVEGYLGCYKVSDYGNVWSKKLKRCLRPDKDKDGYRIVRLSNPITKKAKAYKVHRLVFYTFNPDADKSLQINHIDNVPYNNNLSNLEAVNNRENSAYRFAHRKTSSKYRGVTKIIRDNTWRAQIQINKKKTHLGHFNCETAAYIAYLKALKAGNVTNKYA